MRNFLFVLLAGVQVFAAESTGDSVKYRFKPITVTASKINGAQREIAAGVTVIEERQLRTAMTTSALDAAKDYVPALFVTERALMGYGVASGAAGGITIRGIGGSPVTGVLVLRDGRPDIMGMMGHALPDAYSTIGLESIEVIRGPASFLYGTNAMGGVINLVSKRQRQEGFSTGVVVGAGSFASQKYEARHGGKFGGFDYYVTASRQSTDGHRPSSDYRNQGYTAHLGYALSAATKIELNANYSDIYLLDPGLEPAPKANQWYHLFRSGADLTLDHSGRFGETVVKLHGNFGRHCIYDGWRSNDRTTGVIVYQNLKPWKTNTTTIGFDYKTYGGDAEDSSPKVPVINYRKKFMTEYAPYLHVQQLLLQRMIVSTGVRVEKHELYGWETLPKVGMIYSFPTTSLRLSAAKGFRSPSIRELYVFPPRNEKLEPERLWNYEAGVLQEIADFAEIDLSVFRMQGDNMIRTVIAGGKPQFLNSSRFTHTGYEASARLIPTNNLELRLTWSDVDLGNETLGAPEKKLTATANYTLGRLDLRLQFMHIAGLYAKDGRQDKMPDYSLVDFWLGLKPWRTASFAFKVKNFLDQKYEILKGYPMPGRTMAAELGYEF
ncbi:MAG: TonB-dependent receptor [candidate division KSB1 bacterium]|nr:TonB-dependent receptor [candidate division KSB1 bacterium]